MQRVLKIGGSLLQRPSIGSLVRTWVGSQEPADTVAIVGGGELIDAVRRLDARFPGDPAAVHWQCVGLLTITFDWMGRQLDDWDLVRNREAFQQWRERCVASAGVASAGNASAGGGPEPSRVACHLVDVNSFYRRGEASPLPENWTTTTDAIAGWLSILLRADELVLLKSCDVPEQSSLDELAEQGVIDAALPRLQADLPRVRFVNFAAETCR